MAQVACTQADALFREKKTDVAAAGYTSKPPTAPRSHRLPRRRPPCHRLSRLARCHSYAAPSPSIRRPHHLGPVLSSTVVEWFRRCASARGPTHDCRLRLMFAARCTIAKWRVASATKLTPSCDEGQLLHTILWWRATEAS